MQQHSCVANAWSERESNSCRGLLSWCVWHWCCTIAGECSTVRTLTTTMMMTITRSRAPPTPPATAAIRITLSSPESPERGVCVRTYVRVCVCVRACVRACVWVNGWVGGWVGVGVWMWVGVSMNISRCIRYQCRTSLVLSLGFGRTTIGLLTSTTWRWSNSGCGTGYGAGRALRCGAW